MKYAQHENTNTVRFHVHEAPGGVRFTETEWRQAGGGEGDPWFHGDRVYGHTVVMAAQHRERVNTTEGHTSKWLR